MAHRITDDCIGCGLCATNCPVSAITGDFKDKPNIDEALCIDCGLCKSNCPRDAILGPGEEPPVREMAEDAVKSETAAAVEAEDAAPAVTSETEAAVTSAAASVEAAELETPPAAEPASSPPAKPVRKSGRKHPEFDKASCAGCSVCVVNCPKDILRITEPSHHGSIHNVAYLTDPKACIGCGICAKECPIGAIYMVEDGEKPVYINNTKGLFDM